MRAQGSVSLKTLTRRVALALAATGAVFALTGCGGGGSGGAAEGDMAMGAAEGAKVTVVEYASVTCPHCATWQEETWPAFKAKYVDTGQVRYVFRELPTPPQDVAVAGFLIARCAGEDKYFDVVDQIMRSQAEWRTGTSPRDSLKRIASAAGLNDAQFQACVSDREAIAAMETRIKAAQDFGVSTTPAFFVNGAAVVTPGGGASLADLSAAIDPLLAR